MTDFVPSDKDLLPACNHVLSERLTPLHYRSLTKLAIAHLGYHEQQVNMFRAIEDVRERLPMRRSTDVFYTGKPDFLMAKRQWFRNVQIPLLQPDVIRIPGSAQCGYLGAFEALMRDPHMLDKWHGDAERRNRKRAAGMVLEQHVARWFQQQWPEFYQPPDNHGIWNKPCSHDFKLDIAGKVVLVDVAGRGDYGYKNPSKTSTDLHLLCSIDGDDVIWEGVAPGKLYNQHVVPEESISPINMIVWMNCHKFGVSYQAMLDRNRNMLTESTVEYVA